MAYSETINLVQGDTLPQLQLTIRDQNAAAPGQTLDPENPATWEVINLTGATVRLKIREIGETVLKDTVTGTVTDGLNGKVVFIFNASTLDTSGLFEAEIEVTTQGGGIQTVYDLIRLQVREQF
jgi:hypothetical protein